MNNNLLPSFDKGWYTYTPPAAEWASFDVSENGARISICEGHFGVGKWLFDAEVLGGTVYDFSVECKTAVRECDVYVILTQYSADGKMPVREHAKNAVRSGERIFFSDKVETDAKTVRLTVELWLKGRGVDAVWSNAGLTPAEPLPKRIVRLAPIQMRILGKTREEQFEKMIEAVDAAGKQNPDIIVLGEGMFLRGLGIPLAEHAETEMSEMPMALKAKAKEYNCYIVYNAHERDGDAFYNTSFLFGRDGVLVGKYRKTHLTVTEYEAGLVPGDSYPVFDLDFGRVGMLICYDQFFPRTAEILAERGAELICISTAGDMHHCNFARAMENGVYLATAGMNHENDYGWGSTRVVDPLGRILAETDEQLAAAVADVDLNKKIRRFWMSTGPAQSSVHDDYRYEKNPHSFEKN